MESFYKCASLFLQHAHVLHSIIPNPSEPLHAYRSLRCLATGLVALALLLAVLVGFGTTAQAQGVCSNTPGAGEWIDCREEMTSTEDIDIDTSNLSITTTGSDEAGIKARHLGDGNIDINSQSDMFTSSGSANGNGISVLQEGATGDVVIRATDTMINVGGDSSIGIYALSESIGKLDVDITGGRIETTAASSSGAIHIQHQFSGTGQAGATTLDIGGNAWLGTMGTFSNGVVFRRLSDGPAIANLEDVTISTMGDSSFGILAKMEIFPFDASGDIEVNLRGGVDITTEGIGSDGVYTERLGKHETIGSDAVITATGANSIETMGNFARGLYGVRNGGVTGLDKVRIDVQDIVITTHGTLAHGIYGLHTGIGDIDIDVRNATIMTKGTDIYSGIGTLAHGIYAYNNSRAEDGGSIDIDVEGGSIETQGKYSYGIRGDLGVDNGGEISITMSGGNTVMTTGEFAHGIVAYHYGTAEEKRGISIDIDGSIDVSGTGAQGVRVGAVNASNVVERAAGFDAEDYRNQTVTVNGPIMSAAEGVFLAGGGRVVIGPQGSIDSDSGIAILATGDTPSEVAGDPDIKPKLWVDLNLGGRRVAQAIGDNWIINDGGETTIAVNRTVLHDGETGVTGDTARNGAWNVRMREHGVKVDNRADPDPANWVFTDSTDTTPIITDRDFSTQDFTETRRPLPPPPSCPDGQMGTPPDCTDAETDTDTDTEPEMPMFMEEYAPRAALYETLPGFLLRMAAQGPLNSRLASPESPVWFAFSGGSGEVDPSRSTTGAEYDYDRYRVQFGKNLSFGEGLDGWFAVHYTQGDSEVSSPTGGGDIDAEGAGAAFDLQWQHASGSYLGAHASLTNYDIDLSSDDVGRLRSSVDALGTSLGFEAGRQMAIGETFQMTPRAWLSHSSIDIDSFTDAVDAQASFPDEARLTGGIGALAETMQPWKGGELTWHGSLDLEQMLNSRSTRVNVSGEQLKTETVSTRMLLGLGSLYRKGDFSISTQISADGLGTNDEEYSGQVKIGVRL